ncbi:hypothetical protein PPYR_10478 [Photinus pyralis]|uniref:ABC transporter domain-containing protein n=2 Tax=Photinus pyralis TaxID=7054 RepID=A0A5N4AGG7_PHOPY|nr:ATP-binding cassette sub-family A member 3-like [Photinus pyralis]KAB0796417.1 hypothetical protein PPYR_10478 [Photinus pyralis]
MGTKLRKLYLLTWKNFVLHRRHPFQTLLEILAPLLSCSLLILLRSLVVPEEHAAIFFQPFETRAEILSRNPQTRAIRVLWSPYNPNLEQIVKQTVDAMNRNQWDHFIYPKFVKNSEQLVTDLYKQIDADKNLAGIQFDDNLGGNYPLPHTIDVTLRFPGELRKSDNIKGEDSNAYSWATNVLFPTYQLPGPRDFLLNHGAKPEYKAEGFLQIQEELSLAIINHLKRRERGENFTGNGLHIQMQRFPYPKWISDKLLSTMRLFIPLLVMLGTAYSCVNNVRAVALEKEKQLKEALKMMGLPNWLHWTAWFIKTFLVMFLTQVLIVMILKLSWFGNRALFPRSDGYVILLFLSFYACATTTFCFAITSFFSNANLAATVTGLFWFLSYFPYTFLQVEYDTLTLVEKLGACICSTSAMGYGFQIILMFEGAGEGVHWDNIWETTSPDDTLTLGLVLIMLMVDTILYFLITIYIEAVFPGDFGVGEAWNFPFTAAYWCGQPKYVLLEHSIPPLNTSNEFIEVEPEGLTPGIRLINLGKKYSNNKVAVQNLSLNMYRDQITVLLGHNGAGKTTTMSMLTGVLRPTSGTAIVDGCDIKIDIKGARQSLGLCPQYNVLFEELTVAEHLYFFSKLKGLTQNRVKAEIDKYIELLELEEKRHAQSGTLSGGMQRKLSVGIALCGDSKIVMLDEPTAGMDPAARRALWDLLISQKTGRTILLTTHFMDEADLLGDRIAIMVNGSLQCCGTSFFLKKKYGAGYHLIVEKTKKCNVKQVTSILQEYIPSIQVKSHIGSELSYRLPEDQSGIFEPMLRNLESMSESLGVLSYGISLTTLEEVFMVVGFEGDQDSSVQESRTGDLPQYVIGVPYQDHLEHGDETKEVLLTGWRLWLNQVQAMLMKRLLSILRAGALLLVQNILAILFISLAIIVVRNLKFFDDMPKLAINLMGYSKPITLLTYDDDTDPYVRYLSNHLSKHGVEVVDSHNGSMSDIILEATIKNTPRVRHRYICAFSFEDNDATAWFNNEAYHSPPLCLQLLLNGILHKEVSDLFNIQFHNHPLRFTTQTKLRDLARGHNMGYQIAFNLGFGMAFVSSFYIIFYVKERASKAKHIQFVSGVGVIAFWGSSLLCDLLTFAITSTCICGTVAIFREDGFSEFDDLARMFFALISFSYSMLPITYVSAFLYDVPATGYTKMCLLYVFTGVAGFLAVQVIRTTDLELDALADKIHWALLIVPHYCLSSAIRDMNKVYVIHKTCTLMCEDYFKLNPAATMEQCRKSVCKIEPLCCNTTSDYFDWNAPGVGRNMFFSFVIGTTVIVFLLLIEFKIIQKIRYALTKRRDIQSQDFNQGIQEDMDVVYENELIRNATLEEIGKYAIVMRDMTKYYGKFTAVHKLCLAVDNFECFGLLGLNGAGKTTTFKMMTGDIRPSSGNAWVTGIPLKGNLARIQRLIGYCPQFDALLDDLTCRETLHIFSMLRGLRRKDAQVKAERLALEFDFVKHLDKPVKALSGGNRRKLSTAVSVIGNPAVLYLDEPTTGMDPATKRFLWDALCKIRNKGTCIVLTSHSMEECEALCTRLAIMVNGVFVCIGSPQRLKNRFSDGYTLIVKAEKGSQSEDIEDYINANFPEASLREKYQELLTYYIPPNDQLRWSMMFGIMETAKDRFNIEDYSIGQCSLEQVFLSFTKYQKEAQKRKKTKI